ncbi:hypothetical protein ACWIBQ_03400 [Microbacterium keratanolyticum]
MSALEGMPLTDQYLLQVLPRVTEIAPGARPGSAEFRRALRAVSATTGLLPTRSETNAAMRRLTQRGQIGGAQP